MKKGNVIALNAKGQSPEAPDTLQLLKKELSELKVITETQYKTEGNIDGFIKKVQEETSIDVLVKMYSSVNGKRKAYDVAQTDLQKLLGGNFAIPVFKMNGFTSEAIESDIVLKLKVLSVEKRKNVLETLVKEGEQFLTEEHKYQLYVQKVNQELGCGD